MFFNKSLKKVFVIGLIMLPLQGCEPDLGGSDYETENIGQLSNTQSGVVVFKREIKMHYYPQGAVSQGAVTGAAGGAVGGALIGGAAGGSGGSSVAGGLIGAGLGGLLGYAIDKKTRTHKGFEYHVKLDKSGDVVTVSQGPNPEIGVGGRVLIITPKESDSTRYNSPQKMRSRIVPINY